MASLFNLVENLCDRSVPVTESFVSELLSLRENNYSFKAVNLCLDSFVDDHITDLNFNSILRNTQESSNSSETNTAVVFFNDTEIVLA